MKYVNNVWKWALVVISFTAMVSALPKPGSAQAYYSVSYLAYLLSIRYPALLAIRLPARDLNGIALNGAYFEDRFVTELSLDDVIIPGRRSGKKQTADLNLSGTRFVYPGHKLVGAVFTATLDDGSTLPVRIDAVEERWHRDIRDVIHYYASYESDAGRQPLCGVDENGDPVGAIPLIGAWDYSEGTETGGAKIDDPRVFTFACEGFVIDKCVDAGYKPWLSLRVCHGWGWWRKCEDVSLAGLHQACTRMLRADFCGDGVSYTEDDILVALYDGFGIRYDSEPWELEAEWDEDGAICAGQYRVEGMAPSCFPDLVDDETCGDPSHFLDGALLISELP
jgi:hypothetical protein